MTALVRRAIDVLEREAFATNTAIIDLLHDEALAVGVDAENLELRFGPESIELVALEPHVPVAVKTSVAALVSALDAQESLAELIRSDRIEIIVPLRKLLLLERAFELFVHGLARAPSASSLVRELCGLVSPPRYDDD